MFKIIGSHALIHHFGSKVRYKEPLDIDIIASQEMADAFVLKVCNDSETAIKIVNQKETNKVIYFLENEMIIEAEIAKDGNLAEQFLTLEESLGNTSVFASIGGLYALKMSHRYLKNSPAFLKTMEDIHILRQVHPKEVSHYYLPWFKAREKATYDYGHPKLNVTRGEFFNDDGINYVYDHDSIHEAVALNYTPAYKKFLVDEVKVSRELFEFENLPYFDQLAAVIEESMVLAIERSLVPFNFKPEPKKAYLMALSKVCTSITSGWFREFAWENYYPAAAAVNEFPYDEWFKDALNKNKIRPYVKKVLT